MIRIQKCKKNTTNVGVVGSSVNRRFEELVGPDGVAVGKSVATLPPHRIRTCALTHTAPTSGA